MPHTVNGCGTWYYGKKNEQQYMGHCGSCGKFTALRSYDTRLYVVALFIPIIPLVRRRIIEECAICRRHRVLSLSQWQEARRRIEQAIEAYRQGGRKRDLAQETLAACMGVRDQENFLLFSKEVERDHPQDASLLMVLATCHGMFNRTGDAERLALASLQFDDLDETREFIAQCMLQQVRPSDAEPYLRHIIDEGIPDRVDNLYHLAQVYQAKGEHEKALEVFDHCVAITPQIAEDATFTALRETSERKRGTSTPVDASATVKKVKRRAAVSRGKRLAPTVLALGAICYVAVCWLWGLNRTVYLVNGVGIPYTVRLDGKEYAVPAYGATPVAVVEGALTVEIVDAPEGIEQETVTVYTSLFGRPFNDDTFVINADGAAVLRRVEVWYGDDPNILPSPTENYLAGKTFYRLEGIDYPFEDFPDTIELPSRNARVTRDGIFVVDPGGKLLPSMAFRALADDLGTDTLAEVLRRHVLMDPKRAALLALLEENMDAESFLAFLRPNLAKRPILIEWHRAYQNIMDKLGREAELEQEYDALLASENTPELMYLTARVSSDPDRSIALCEQAAGGDAPFQYAQYWLCGYHLANGAFSQAARYALEASAAEWNDPSVEVLCRRALLANGDFEKVLELVRPAKLGPYPLFVYAFADEVYALTVLGRAEDARKTAQGVRPRVAVVSRNLADETVRQLEASLAYISGDAETYVKTLEPSKWPATQLERSLARRDLEDAEKQLEKTGGTSATDQLLVYLLASEQDDSTRAERHLTEAIELLEAGRQEERAVAGILRRDENASPEAFLRLHLWPDDKVVYLTAAGVRNPQQRKMYFDLARVLNVNKRFPYMLVRELLDHEWAR